MQYFYDTEFHERGAEHPIDLISIGVVAEDGREYYAQHAGFDFMAALEHPWLMANVLPQLQICGSVLNSSVHAFSFAPTHYDLLQHDLARHGGHSCDWDGCPWRSRLELVRDLKTFIDPDRYGKPQLYGYYSAYDHVVLCQIFGSMSDLPAGFPMWTRDLKQYCVMLGDPHLPDQGKGEHHALSDAKWNKMVFEWLLIRQAQANFAMERNTSYVRHGDIRLFTLQRSRDISGVSGTGHVADGAIFPNGKLVLAWRSQWPSVIVYDSMEDLIAVHGHDGATEVVYLDNAIFPAAPAPDAAKSAAAVKARKRAAQSSAR